MKNLLVKSITKASGEGQIEAIVATEDVDRDGEILDIKGLDIKKFQQNPVVLWAHDYSKPPIGRAEKLTKKADGSLVAKIKFAITESDFAKEVYALYKGGFLNAFSIGFIPSEADGNRFTKSEMLEFSAVPVPANPNALMTAKAKGIVSDKTIEKLELEEEEIDEDEVETKTITVDTKTLDEAVAYMKEVLDDANAKLNELKELNRTGASLHKKRVRLVGVRKSFQKVQSTAQSANGGFAKLKGARSIRKVEVKLKN